MAPETVDGLFKDYEAFWASMRPGQDGPGNHKEMGSLGFMGSASMRPGQDGPGNFEARLKAFHEEMLQ